MDNCVQRITIKVTAEKAEYVEGLCDYIKENYPDVDVDFSERKDYYEITASESGEAHFYPGRMTLANGDPGYPDEWDDNFEMYEGDIEELIEKYVSENFEGEEISDWSVSANYEGIEYFDE